MSKTLIYTGPFEKVAVTVNGLDRIVTKGEPFEVADKIADRLLDQAIWKLEGGDGDAIPEKAQEVISWIGTDVGRAQRVLEVEGASSNRSTVMTAASALIETEEV